MKCNLTLVTPRASTSQGLPESWAVDPVHTSLKLQHAKLKVNWELLALAKDSLTMSEQQLRVDHAMVDMLHNLVGAMRQVGSGCPLQPVVGGQVGGILLQVEGVSWVEVSMPRAEVRKGKEKEKEVVTVAGGDGVEEDGDGEVEMAEAMPDVREGGEGGLGATVQELGLNNVT